MPFINYVMQVHLAAEILQKALDLDENKGTQMPRAMTAMNARFGLPNRLGEMEVTSHPFSKIVTDALADHCHKTNPASQALKTTPKC